MIDYVMGSKSRTRREKKSKKSEANNSRQEICKKSESYKVYIHNVLKSIDSEYEISPGAMGIMDSLIKDHLEKLASEAGRLTQYNKKPTLDSREIRTAVRLTFPGELGKHAVTQGNKALDEYMSTEPTPPIG